MIKKNKQNTKKVLDRNLELIKIARISKKERFPMMVISANSPLFSASILGDVTNAESSLMSRATSGNPLSIVSYKALMKIFATWLSDNFFFNKVPSMNKSFCYYKFTEFAIRKMSYWTRVY